MKKFTGILVPHTLRKKRPISVHGGSSIWQQSRNKEDARSFPATNNFENFLINFI